MITIITVNDSALVYLMVVVGWCLIDKSDYASIYIICINYQHDSCVHVIYIVCIINSDSMTLDDAFQRGPEVQTETVQEDEELEDVAALDDIFGLLMTKILTIMIFVKDILNEIDSWSRIFELSREFSTMNKFLFAL